MNLEYAISPCCRHPLEYKEKEVFCNKCMKIYTLRKGILDLSDNDFYWNQVNKDDMTQILEDCRTKGWRASLEGLFLSKTNDYHLNYAVNESRADFSFYMDINKDSHVLDFGPGWGAVTIALARKAGKLVCADTTMETLQFVKLRSEQEGLNNLEAIRINPLDYTPYPFKDEEFDFVILNGVLEWIGAARQDMRPSDIQLAALKEIRRILKADGQLYIGIENRWGYNMFMGAKDHSGIPFTSIMPRCVANYYTIRKINSPYRTYTYSSHGYSKILKEAGFKDAEYYLPLESYRFPDEMIPLGDKRSIRNYFKEYSSWKNWLIFSIFTYLNLYKNLVPHYSIFIKK